MPLRKAVPVLFLILLLATPVLAKHTPGKGSYVSVATDGFDNGYYLIVWSNSSGVYGQLYRVKDNQPVGNVIEISSSGGSRTALASMKADATEPNDNEYLVVWIGSDNYPYARLLSYDGSPLSDVIQLDSENTTDFVGAAYGNGYFIALYEGGTSDIYQNLYYSIIDTQGNVVDHGILYSFDGAIHYSRSVAYDPVSGYFGVFLRNKDSSRNHDATFLDFRISDGKLDRESIHTLLVVDNEKVYGTAIAPANGGFVIAYETGYKWYTYRVNLNNGNPTLATDSPNGGYYRGYRAYGGGTMDFVENGTKDYIIFAYENIESNGGKYEVVIERLNLDGVPLDNDGSGDYVISESGKDHRYPAIVAKPAGSPAAYIVGWSDTTDGTVYATEYKDDFTEVSQENQVPFFGNAGMAGLLVLTLALLFRRR